MKTILTTLLLLTVLPDMSFSQLFAVEPDITETWTTKRNLKTGNYYYTPDLGLGGSTIDSIDRKCWATFDVSMFSPGAIIKSARLDVYGDINSGSLSGHSIATYLLEEWSPGSAEEAYQNIEGGTLLDVFQYTGQSQFAYSINLMQANFVDLICERSSISIGFSLDAVIQNDVGFSGLTMYIEYLGGATAAFSVDNVIEPGTPYSGANNRIRIGAGEFLEPPVAREAFLGADFSCEVWNARYDSTSDGIPRKQFLWDMYVNKLPPFRLVENFDTVQTGSEFKAYAGKIYPATISSEDEYGSQFDVDVKFFDPWRII